VTEARHPAAGSPGQGSIVVSYRGSDGLFADRMDAARDLGAEDLVVDFGDVETLSVTVLEILVRNGRELRAEGGRLAVVCLHPSLRALLRCTLLDRVFPVHTSVESALRQPA
jgi:anti-sigma B factor antagonist